MNFNKLKRLIQQQESKCLDSTQFFIKLKSVCEYELKHKQEGLNKYF